MRTTFGPLSPYATPPPLGAAAKRPIMLSLPRIPRKHPGESIEKGGKGGGPKFLKFVRT